MVGIGGFTVFQAATVLAVTATGSAGPTTLALANASLEGAGVAADSANVYGNVLAEASVHTMIWK